MMNITTERTAPIALAIPKTWKLLSSFSSPELGFCVLGLGVSGVAVTIVAASASAVHCIKNHYAQPAVYISTKVCITNSNTRRKNVKTSVAILLATVKFSCYVYKPRLPFYGWPSSCRLFLPTSIL